MNNLDLAQASVAVVVLNWNGLDLLRRFIPNWLEYIPEWAELIIADNGSTDDSLTFVSETYPQITCIALGHNYGFAEGYNRAIASLDHRYVVLLNSDATLSLGWLDEPMALLEARPQTWAVQPKVLDYNQAERFEYAGAAGGYLDILAYPFCAGRIFDTLEVDTGQYDQLRPVMWASGACLIIRREMYMAVGGLDSRFFAHQEEIDLCWRIRARGGEILYAPQSRVYHIGGASLDARNPKKTYLNFRNNLLMLYKNMPLCPLLGVLLLRGLLDAVASLRFLLSGQYRQAWAIVRAWVDALFMMPRFRASRQENLSKQRLALKQILSPYSIVWQYYVRGRKTYNELRSYGGIFSTK